MSLIFACGIIELLLSKYFIQIVELSSSLFEFMPEIKKVLIGVAVGIGKGVGVGEGVTVVVGFCNLRNRAVAKMSRKRIIEPTASHFAAFPCRFKSFSRKVGALRSFSLGAGNSFSCGGGESCCIKLSFHVVKFLSMIFIFSPTLRRACR